MPPEAYEATTRIPKDSTPRCHLPPAQICTLAERYAPDTTWFIATMAEVRIRPHKMQSDQIKDQTVEWDRASPYPGGA